MSRYKTEIEKSLVRIEYALEKLQPNAALSAEALQGIEKQLNAALPRRNEINFFLVIESHLQLTA